MAATMHSFKLCIVADSCPTTYCIGESDSSNKPLDTVVPVRAKAVQLVLIAPHSA